MHSSTSIDSGDLCVFNAAGAYAGSVHTVITTKSNRLYTCGRADYTGHGTRHDIFSPAPLPCFDGIEIQQVSIASGGFHTLVLTADGRLFAWGHNRVGQLGIPARSEMPRNEDGGYYLPSPEEVINVPEHIVSVSAGWGHSGLLTTDGLVYMCGRNVEGQLGIHPAIELPVNERSHRFSPLFTHTSEGDLAGRKISQIICGGEHTIFYGSDHDVMGVGLTNRGQLGLFSQNNLSFAETRMIDYFKHEQRSILQISCGFSCSLVLLGRRTPASLRNMCSDIIRNNMELRHRVLDDWDKEDEPGDVSSEEMFYREQVRHAMC